MSAEPEGALPSPLCRQSSPSCTSSVWQRCTQQPCFRGQAHLTVETPPSAFTASFCAGSDIQPVASVRMCPGKTTTETRTVFTVTSARAPAGTPSTRPNGQELSIPIPPVRVARGPVTHRLVSSPPHGALTLKGGPMHLRWPRPLAPSTCLRAV